MNRKKLYCHLLCCISLILFINIQELNAQVKSVPLTKENSRNIFKAGASTTNITPHLGGDIVGNFGIPSEATYVHDELHNRCLVLDDGATQLVLVIVDNISLKRVLIDAAKSKIEKETGIPRSNILISATHTHSSVSAGGKGEKRGEYSNETFDEYQKFLIKRIAESVRIALNNLEPAKIGWGVGSVPEHVYVRRWILKDPIINPFGEYDKVQFNPGHSNKNKLKPASIPDPEVSFVSIKSASGKPIALLANYSLHYVGGVPKNHISADYFAVFADRIQKLLKADRQEPPFVGIMTNGTSGDVNNINFGGESEKNKPYKKIRRVAEDLARKVYHVENGIEYYNWVPLGVVTDEITLDICKPDEKLIIRSRNVLERPDSVKPIHNLEKTYAENIIRLLNWPDQIDIVVQTLQIGDLGIAAIPFETFAEIGREIKEKSPFKNTFTIELANGSYGYLSTPEQHELGGYETWWSTNKVQKDASTKITNKIIEQFVSMQNTSKLKNNY